MLLNKWNFVLLVLVEQAFVYFTKIPLSIFPVETQKNKRRLKLALQR